MAPTTPSFIDSSFRAYTGLGERPTSSASQPGIKAIKLAPLQPLPNPSPDVSNLPSFIDSNASTNLLRLLRDGPWMSYKEPSPDKWVFRPLGTDIYQGRWQRLTDGAEILLDLKSTIEASPLSPTGSRSFSVVLNEAFMYDNPMDPSCRPSRTSTNSTRVILGRALRSDRNDRAHRLFSSMPGAINCSSTMSLPIGVSGSMYRFRLAFCQSNKVYQISTEDNSLTGQWKFCLVELVLQLQASGEPVYTRRVCVSGQADKNGVEISFNYDTGGSNTRGGRPRTARKEHDLGWMHMELAMLHYTILSLGNKKFIPSKLPISDDLRMRGSSSLLPIP